jgi:hypothetical protein
MIEIIHASAMIGKWLEQLPANVQDWLRGSYWYFIAACLGILIWRLSHSKDTLPHGEVKLTWYKPTQWLRRWEGLREQGYANAPSWYPKYMLLLQTCSNWIGGLFGLILALTCFALAYAWDDWWRLLWLAGGFLAVWWSWTMVRPVRQSR